MDPIRVSVGIMTLGFVTITHLIGFNNVRVFGNLWMPEFVLIVYALFSLVPFEKFPQWFEQLKKRLNNRRRSQKVVKINSRLNKVSIPVVFDGMLLTAVACLSLYLVYRL